MRSKRVQLFVLIQVIGYSGMAAAQTQDQYLSRQSYLCAGGGGTATLPVSIAACTVVIEAGRKNPTDLAKTYSSRGFWHKVQGEHQRAISDYDEAIRLDPKNLSFYLRRGSAYHETSQYDRAVADFDEAIRIKSDDWVGYIVRGITYSTMGQHDRAIADFDEAIRLHADDYEAFVQRGITFSAMGQHARAIADFDEAIRINPEMREAYYNRGLAHDALGQRAQADADFAHLRRSPVAVGTRLTPRPPHRSERALLTHSAPALDV